MIPSDGQGVGSAPKKRGPPPSWLHPLAHPSGAQVVIPQQTVKPFVETFVRAFRDTEWPRYRNGDDCP
jgi:hypothetical protein